VVNGLTPETAYTFSVTARDAAANEADNNPQTVGPVETAAAPVNTECEGTDTEASEGTFTDGYHYHFTTSGADVTINVELLDTRVGLVAFFQNWTTGALVETQVPMNGNTFTTTLTNQTTGSDLTFAVKFAYAGGLSITKMFTYTVGETCSSTPPENDTEAPHITQAAAGTVTHNSATLLLNATDNLTAAITYTIECANAAGSPFTAYGSPGTQVQYVVNGLTPETAYTFSVTARDAAANEADNNPQTVAITTTATPQTYYCRGTSNENMDGQPGFITGYNYEFAATGGEVTISFELLDGKEGVVGFLWDYSSGGMIEKPMTTMPDLKTVTITLTGQTPGAILPFACKFAYAGGMTVTKQFNYVVGEECAPPADTEGPHITQAAVGTVTANSIELLLNATDNAIADITYTIACAGVAGSPFTTTSYPGTQKTYTVNGLSAATAYTFTITAEDAAGNPADNNPQTVGPVTTETSGMAAHHAATTVTVNKATGRLNIRSTAAFSQVTLTNMAGQTVKTVNSTTRTDAIISIDRIPAGIYLLTLTGRNGTEYSCKVAL
jgi:hypothetical protein